MTGRAVIMVTMVMVILVVINAKNIIKHDHHDHLRLEMPRSRCPARAVIKLVLPQPGGPCSKIPRLIIIMMITRKANLGGCQILIFFLRVA